MAGGGTTIQDDAVHILLVDDRPENLLALEAVLNDPTYALVRAASGEDALRQILAADFAAVLLDVQMPGLSGFEVAKLIRDRQKTRHTPIIFLTATADDEFPVEKAYALGAVDYLVKPVSPVVLRAKLAVFVDLYRRTREATAAERRRADAAQARLAAIVESSDDAIIGKDLDGTVRFWNTGAERVFGYAAAEAVGQSITLIIPPDRLDEERDILARLRRGERIDHFETVRVAKSGSLVHVSLTVSPLRDADGKLTGASKVARDITARVQAEREIEAERRQLAEVFDFAPSFMCVLRGPDHVFERANERYYELLGRRDILGRTVREAIPEVAGQGFLEILDTVYRTGEPYSASAARLTLERAGRLEERVLEFVYQPMCDAAGRVTGILAHGIDLTDRERAQEGLTRVTAESERQRRMFDSALSNTADFVYLFDLAGRFTYVNKALLDLWGKDLPEAVGKDFFELDYPPELAARLQQQIQTVIATKKPLRDETPYTSGRGTRAYEYIFMPVLGADGEVEAVAGSTRDITDRKEGEEALRRGEERYRVLVTASSDVVYRLSADWEEMYPLDGRNLVPSSDAEALRGWMARNVPAFEHARVTAAIRAAIAAKGTFELEHQVLRPDGTLGWTYSRAAPILDADGEIAEWFGTARDVTGRKEAEEELKDIRSRMEAALEVGAIGTWAWDIPADRFFGDASLARIFGVEPEAVAGGPLAGVAGSIHPDDVGRVFELINRAVETGVQYEADYRVVRPDGSVRWVSARGQVERDTSGRAVRFPGVVIDVTERKLAEAALARVTAESERLRRLHETVLSATPDFVYVFSLDHRVLYANDSLIQMWGRGHEGAIGKTFLEIGYEPWHAEMHDREIDQVRATRQPIRGEVPFHGTLGRRIYDYIFVPVFGVDGEVEAVAGTTRDVTDRKQAEEAVRDADRKKDDFLALLAHELRNPLAPLRNGLQVMRLAPGDAAAVTKSREMMDRQLAHMVRLIDDLLDVSRISRNKMELRRTRLFLSDVVSSAVETVRPAIDAAGHDLSISLPREPIPLDADLTRLAQVIGNLLSNSAKYTPPGGRIRLSADARDGEAVVTIADDGIGIPAASLPNIFDMFSQVDRSIERSTGGLGIGLALVKGLVEMHGGTVTAASDGQGRGSTFTVRLPVLPSPPEAARASANGATSTGSPGRRILVVDDNRDSAESLSMMLGLMGNEVAVAHDGLQAVEAAERVRPDVILMDVGMPRLNGLDATRRIREQAWGRDAVIIALTGWGQEGDRARSKEAGCDGHLVKPVELEDLSKLLSTLRS